MTDVILCAKCGRGLRPGQTGTWREFLALEQVGTKSARTIRKEYTGRTFCGECAMPPPAGLWDPGPGGTGAPVGSKSLVGAAR